MTDANEQAPKKPVRPNLFGPPHATRMADERISVLASLDANPPPKKRKKRGLARGTIAMLGITGLLFAGVIYLAMTQARTDSSNDETGAAPATPPVASFHEQAPTTPGDAASEAPSLSLSELAASAPRVEASAPASAVIETVATQPEHNPVAILEADKSAHAATENASGATANKSAATHGSPSSLLKALNAPAPADKPAQKHESPTTQPVPKESAKPVTRMASALAKPAASARSSAAKAAPVDTDVVLLEGLLTTSNRQEAKDRAARNKTTEPGKSVEKAE